MMNKPKCAYCRADFMDTDRVIFSHKNTFTFKPADVPDTVNAAKVSPAELAESRKEHQRTAVVNTIVDWGKAAIPEDAFHFRHQWCEPVRTASGVGSGSAINKHAIRFTRTLARGKVMGGQK